MSQPALAVLEIPGGYAGPPGVGRNAPTAGYSKARRAFSTISGRAGWM